MRKFLFLLLMLIIVMAAACAPRPEMMLEQLIEQSLRQEGKDVDIDVSGDGSVQIKDKDEQVTIDSGTGMLWPGDKLPTKVPPVPGVKVEMVMDMGTGILVSFTGCDQATAEAYAANLKSLGWESSMDMQTEDGYVFVFASDNESLTFSWEKQGESGSITYGKS